MARAESQLVPRANDDGRKRETLIAARIALDDQAVARQGLSAHDLAQEHLLLYSSVPEESFVLRRVLAPRGRLVIVGGENGGRWLGGTDRQIRAQLLSLVVHQQLGTFIAKENAGDLDVLREAIDAGTLTPAVDRSYPLADTAAALRHLLDGHTRGKLVITVHDPDES